VRRKRKRIIHARPKGGVCFYTMAAQVKWELRRTPTCPHARAYYDDLGVDAHPALTGRAQHLARFSEPRILREPEQLRTCPVCRPYMPRSPLARPPDRGLHAHRLAMTPHPYRLTALPHSRHIPRDGSRRPQDDQPAQDSDGRQQEHGTVEAEPVRERPNERKRDRIADQMNE
jgi:hypothetical protein